MKKRKLLNLLVVIIGMITVIAVTANTNPSHRAVNGRTIPDSLKKIFNASCASCHSDEGKIMARSKLNFSQWDEYSKNEMVIKSKAICEQVTEGSMPPASVRKSKPETIPTDAQIKYICNWADSLGKLN
jgi:hypothetical protein